MSNFALQNPTRKMAAIDMSLVARSEYALHQLVKRKNWAQREPGVIVVLVIVFLVAILVLAMFINKKVCLSSYATCSKILSYHYRGKRPLLENPLLKIPPSRFRTMRRYDRVSRAWWSGAGSLVWDNDVMLQSRMWIGKSLCIMCVNINVWFCGFPFGSRCGTDAWNEGFVVIMNSQDTSMSIPSQYPNLSRADIKKVHRCACFPGRIHSYRA